MTFAYRQYNNTKKKINTLVLKSILKQKKSNL